MDSRVLQRHAYEKERREAIDRWEVHLHGILGVVTPEKAT